MQGIRRQVHLYRSVCPRTHLRPVLSLTEKNAVATYAQSQPSFTSAVNISAGWYLENFLVAELAPIFGGFPHIPSEDGSTFVFRTPTWGGAGHIPYISISGDFGDIVHGILLSPPEQYNGKLVQGFSDAVTAEELVATFTRATGKPARNETMPNGPEGIETYGMSALVTVKEMFAWVSAAGGNYYGVPNDSGPAKELKRRAVEAQGGAEADKDLMSVEYFWKNVFPKA